MPPGKRLSAGDPLTEHDVAERIDRAALRLLRIMGDIRQQGGMEAVRHSRYLTNVLGMLAAELTLWGVEPDPGWIDATRDDEWADPGTAASRSQAEVLDQARVTREHMRQWAAGQENHPGEEAGPS
jgi:hypothetical protein